MDTSSALPLERQLAATLSWWRMAGVDQVFADTPQPLLRAAQDDGQQLPAGTEPMPAATDLPVQPPPRIGGAADSWPRDLAAFPAWWLAEPTLDLGGAGPRVAPRGGGAAALMVLVPMPEAADGDTLLSGKEGLLVANMLAAMGIAPGEAYLAAALPRHMAQPDWADLARLGLGAILLHLLGLVRPRRLLVLGRGILPLLGHDPAQSPAAIKQTSIQAAAGNLAVPTLAGFAPDRLLDNPRQRALLWRQWLDWTETDA